jgi:hypothetical protein
MSRRLARSSHAFRTRNRQTMSAAFCMRSFYVGLTRKKPLAQKLPTTQSLNKSGISS